MVLEPLREADPPWTLERMASELGRRVTEDKDRNAARGDVSGRARPTLQKFFAGKRVPTRDVVQHLLDIAAEVLQEPPTAQQVGELWSAYRAASRTTFPLLADLYDAVDERDAAFRRAEKLQRTRLELVADQERLVRQEQRLKTLLGHARTEAERSQRVARIRHDEARRAREEADRLAAQTRELQAEREKMMEDADRLKHELRRLREQPDPHQTASSSRIGEVIAAQAALSTECTELDLLLHTVQEAAHAARAQALATQASSDQPDTAAQTRTQELERRHATAMQAVAHLSEQLRQTSGELATARAELVRRDGDLARLVEQHAQEMDALLVSSLLAEADDVLSLALQRLELAPALPAPGNVPTPETIHSLSSAGPTAPAQEMATPPAGHVESAPDQRQQPSSPAPPTPAVSASGSYSAGAGRRGETSATAQHPAGAKADGDDHAVSARKRWLSPPAMWTGVIMCVVGLGLVPFLWLEPPSDSRSEAGKSSPSAKSSTPVGSPLPSQPADDPVADIGSQPVNTAAIMKLGACKAADITVKLTSAANSYATDEEPRLTMTVKADSDTGGQLPCRINLSRADAYITVTPAEDDEEAWTSSACADGHAAPRWVQLTRSKPVNVEFLWNRRLSSNPCDHTGRAGVGTYLAEAVVLKHKAQTSFVLAPEQSATPPAKPSPSWSPSAPADSSASGGTSVGGLPDSGNGGQATASASESTSDEPTGSTAETAVGGTGNGGTGNDNGGLFGGPTG